MKRGLRHQAEGVITLSGFCQQLYAAEMELIDLLPEQPPMTTQDVHGTYAVKINNSDFHLHSWGVISGGFLLVDGPADLAIWPHHVVVVVFTSMVN